MTQEERNLLLKDLCMRLAFGTVKCQVKVVSFNEEMDEHIELLDDEIIFIEPGIYNVYLYEEGTDVDISNIKPYLRSMSSMTEEEKDEFEKLSFIYDTSDGSMLFSEKGLDWLNEHHFDYRGLIEKGLALEAPEGMYK